MTPSLSKTITAEAGPERAKSKSRDGSFHGRVRAQRFQSSIIAALSARVASRAFIGPLPQKATLADFPNVGKGSDSVVHDVRSCTAALSPILERKAAMQSSRAAYAHVLFRAVACLIFLIERRRQSGGRRLA